ncbi:MAG: hypothetical protein GF401_17130 [Chitinivibrionales bacterium]|nr:hypothetical protein [Chitinivibrionales bacterium]
MSSLFDAHCHLQHPQFKNNIVEVLGRARSTGIEEFMCCGMGEQDWEGVAWLAENITSIYPSFGLHPRKIDIRNEIWSEKLINYLIRFPSAGIGEIGLDYSLASSTHKEQERIFTSQLQMAQQLMRPVTVFCQYAWEKLVEILNKIGPLPAGGLIRAYAGPPELIDKMEKAGFYISFTNWICPARADEPRKAIGSVSCDRLCIESDTQYTVLPEQKAELNHPSVLGDICSAIAGIRDMTGQDVAELTCKNARRLFCSRAA